MFKNPNKNPSVNFKSPSLRKELKLGNSKFVNIDSTTMQIVKGLVENIIGTIVQEMIQQSPWFSRLFPTISGAGSSYENLKVTQPDEFDLDIVLQMPGNLKLVPSNRPGLTRVKLTNPTHRFTDKHGNLSSKKVKHSVENLFDTVLCKTFRKNVRLPSYDRSFRVEKIDSVGPAFTIALKLTRSFRVTVDLAPCIRIENSWPKHCRQNPFPGFIRHFHLVAPMMDSSVRSIDKSWRFSFPAQERLIVCQCPHLSQAARTLKRIRDQLGHTVISSYYFKTLDMMEVIDKGLRFTTAERAFVQLLGTYLSCLKEGNIRYFWDQRLNLLEGVDKGELLKCQEDMERLLLDIKKSPSAIHGYLKK